MTHEATPGDRLLVETSASFANVDRDRAGSGQRGEGRLRGRTISATSTSVALAQTWTCDRGARNLVRGGFELRRYDASFDYAKHSTPSS